MSNEQRNLVLACMLTLGLLAPTPVRAGETAEKKLASAHADAVVAVKLAKMKTLEAERKVLQTRVADIRRQILLQEKLVDLANREFERLKPLRPVRAISEQEYLETEWKAVQAAQTLESLKQALHGAEGEIELCELRHAELQAEVEEARARAALLRLPKTEK